MHWQYLGWMSEQTASALKVRPLAPEESHLLDDFLYLAIHQEDPSVPVPRAITCDPHLAKYIENWGRRSDRCLVAVSGDQVVGAVWSRLVGFPAPGYGYVDEETPEVSISVVPSWRGQGVGTALMTSMLSYLSKDFHQVSLSCQKSNAALDLYLRLGFTIHHEDEKEAVMLMKLGDLGKKNG